jgi:hypothetical protein
MELVGLRLCNSVTCSGIDRLRSVLRLREEVVLAQGFVEGDGRAVGQVQAAHLRLEQGDAQSAFGVLLQNGGRQTVGLAAED